MDDFLKTSDETSKRRLINKFMSKQYLDKFSMKTVVISIENDSEKVCLTILTVETKVSIYPTRQVDVFIICTNDYHSTFEVKKA